MMKKIIKFLSCVASNLRGEQFALDDNISFSYLLNFMFSKVFAMLRGILVLGKLNCFISYSSKIKCPSKIRVKGTLVVNPHSYIDALSVEGIVFGKSVSVGRYTSIECSGSLKNLGKGFFVEDNVGLGSNCFYGCAGGIKIGHDTIVGNFVSMHSENHNYQNPGVPIRFQGVSHKGIVIGSNCWIGAKATILDGVVLGNGCVVAAGAVVTGSFPNDVVIGGVPAKIIKRRINLN